MSNRRARVALYVVAVGMCKKLFERTKPKGKTMITMLTTKRTNIAERVDTQPQ